MANYSTSVKRNEYWLNKHETLRELVEEQIWLENDTDLNQALPKLRSTIQPVQDLIKRALNESKRLRPVGSSWSLSQVAYTDELMLDTRGLYGHFRIYPQDLNPASTLDASKLYYFQCGKKVKSVNDLLQTQNLSLMTHGSSDGQTVLGVTSTGTHGSAWDVGAIHDSIVAIHVVTAGQNIILERKEQPVVTPELAQQLGATIKVDTDLFNAAVVGVGCFGVVYGVIVKVTELYGLSSYRKRMPFTAGFRQALDAFDLSKLPTPRPKSEIPFHYEIDFHPYDVVNGERQVYARTLYKTAPISAVEAPPAKMKLGDDLLAVLGPMTDKLPFGAGRLLIDQLIASVFPEHDDVRGNPRQMFTESTTRGQGMSIEIGVPVGATSKAFDIIVRVCDICNYVGFGAIRFVKQSPAYMALNAFAPYTAMFELPGVFANSTKMTYEMVLTNLEAAGIPYRLHWGQQGTRTPARMKYMYGSDLDRWVAARNRFLALPEQYTFSTPFFDTLGIFPTVGVIV